MVRKRGQHAPEINREATTVPGRRRVGAPARPPCSNRAAKRYGPQEVIDSFVVFVVIVVLVAHS